MRSIYIKLKRRIAEWRAGYAHRPGDSYEGYAAEQQRVRGHHEAERHGRFQF